MKRLNVKLVAWLAASSIILVAGIYLLHGWQIKRTTALLKKEAETAKSENNPKLAVRKFGEYLQYSGGDPETQVVYALLTAEIAEGPDATWRERRRALESLEVALRRDPNNDEIRRKLLDYSLMFRLFGDAKEHAEKLVLSAPKGGDPAKEAKLLTLLAASQANLDKERDAVESLRKAVETDPHAIEACIYLAQLLREKLDDAESADKVAERMIADNSENAVAYLQHARYVQSSRAAVSEDEAARLALVRKNDVKKALELAPDDADAILMRAQVYIEDKEPAAAHELLTKGVAKHPKDQRLITTLASLQWGQGRQAEAADEIKKGLEADPKNPNLRMYSIELLLDKGDLTAVRKQIDELELIEGVSRELVDYLRARTLFAEKKWAEASRELTRIRPSMPPTQQIGIDLYLGRCHEMLGEPDKQIEVYQRALSVKPDLIAAHVGLSTALVATGKLDDARKRLEGVLAAIGAEKFVANPLLRNNLINLLVDYNSKRPEKDRDWSTVNQLVDAAVKAQPDALEVGLLQAEVMARMNKLPEARKVLETARDKNPKSLEAWLGLARLSEREGNPAAALAILDQTEKSLGDSAAVRTARLGLSSLIDDETAKKALAAAAQGIDKFTPDEQERMWRALGMGYYRLKDTKEASQWWAKSVRRTPGDLRMRLALFEIASQAADDVEMRAQIDDLKKFVRGESPEVDYFEARRLVQLARTKEAKDRNKLLDQAGGRLKRAAESRPRWAVVPRAEAEVDDLQGRRDEAIVHLERAVELGDTDAAVLQRLIELLQSRGRDEDAKKYFALMSARNPGDEDLLAMSLAEKARREGNLPNAIELTEKAVKQAPEDARKLLYLGQLYFESGRIAEAEKTMSLAVEKGSDLPLTWLALMKLLVDTGKSKEARELMDKMGTKLPPQEGQLVQAQGFEMLKDNEQAEALLRKTRDAKPNDLGLSRVLAMFLFRTKQIEKAGLELERIVAAKPATEADANHQAWANREIARVDVGRDTSHAAAEKALDRLRNMKNKTVEDKVTMAAILAGRSDAASRTEAIQILEEMGKNLTADGRYTLAILYDRVGNWAKCREQMLTLLSDEKQEKKANHLAHFIELLLKYREVDLAETWVLKLEALQPAEPLTIAARARWLVRKGRKEEGVALLRTLVPQPLPPQNVDRLAQVAKVMEELELYEAAESMYREFVALAPKNVLVLAEFLGRRGRLKEAMDVCEQARTAASPASPEAIAQVSLTALRSQPKLLGADEWSRIEGWFTAGLAKKPDSLLLKMQLAEFYDLQGKSGLVEETYRGLLDDPKLTRDQKALIMNNLAFLLAVQRKNGEASQFIEQAIAVIGPTSDLLDTKALVLLSEDQVEKAISTSKQALEDKPSGTKYFHLAQAHLKANDLGSAAEAMRKATEDFNLKLTDLGELEQPIYKRLVQELGVK